MSVYELKSREMQTCLDRLNQLHAQEIKQSSLVIAALERDRGNLMKQLEEKRLDCSFYMTENKKIAFWKNCSGVMLVFMLVVAIHKIVEVIV